MAFRTPEEIERMKQMRQDLTINDVGKTWKFGDEQVWAVKSNGKSYAFYSAHKPVIGSYIPCDVVERPGKSKDDKPITYRDARPIPKEILNDDVPDFKTPSQQAANSAQMPLDTLFKRIPHRSEPGVYMYEPVESPPEWSKPPPKATLQGVEVIIERLIGHFTDTERQNGMNFWQGFFSLAATVCRDYDDGKLDLGQADDDVLAEDQAFALAMRIQKENELKERTPNGR